MSSLVNEMETQTLWAEGEGRWVDHALSEQIGVFAPVTLTELLSDPKLPSSARKHILDIPLLSLADGFWERAASFRAKVLARG